jgi:hypothetical protein
MQKILILVLFIANSFVGKGQKTITEDIWTAQMRTLQMYATFSIDDKGEKNIERINFVAQDQRYSSIVSIIGLFHGSPKESIEWFKKLIEILKNDEVGTSVKLEKQNVTVQKTMGQKYLSIDEFNGGNGFKTVTQGKLETGLENLQDWLNSKGIDLNKEILPKQINETEKPEPTQKNDLVADELIKLKKLMDEGVLTKEEFEAKKKKLLEK